MTARGRFAEQTVDSNILQTIADLKRRISALETRETKDATVAEADQLVTLDATTATFGGLTTEASDPNLITTLSGSVGLQGTADPAIFAGSATPASAPFRVTHAGDVTLNTVTCTGDMQSSNYSAGAAGFKIAGASGNVEINNLTARGEMKTFLLTASSRMAVAGDIVVAPDSGKIAADVAGTATKVDFGKALTVGDWVQFKGPDATGSNSLEVMLLGTLDTGTTYNVTRNVDGSGANAWSKDTPFVVMGHSGSNRIELVAGATGTIKLITQGATYDAGTVQAEMSTVSGAITAGAGAVVLNADGIGIAVTTTYANPNSLTFLSGTTAVATLGCLVSTATETKWKLDASSLDKNAKANILLTSASGKSAGIILLMDSTADFKIDKTAGGVYSLVFNSLNNDVDTVINGDTVEVLRVDASADTLIINETGASTADVRMESDSVESMFHLDASANTIGIGGAPSGSYTLEVTGSSYFSGLMTPKQARSDWQTINDDAVFSFTPPNTAGQLLIGGYNSTTAYGWISFYCGATPTISGYLLGSATVVGTGSLAAGGSGGTDTKFNINSHSDGKIYLKNRLGSSIQVSWLTM